MNTAQKFLETFTHAPNELVFSRIRTSPNDKGKMWDTWHKNNEITVKLAQDHLSGDGLMIGVSPHLNDDTCDWGVIDLDNHKEQKAVDVWAISLKLSQRYKGTFVCRSRSNGAHVYVFFSERIPVSDARIYLEEVKRYLETFVYECGVDKRTSGNDPIEIMPRRDEARNSDGDIYNSIKINLPYYSGLNICHHNEQDIYDVEDFLDLISREKFDVSKIIDSDNVNRTKFIKKHQEAPPCLHSIIECGGITENGEIGYRNNATYNWGVYLKKSGASDPNKEAELFNELAFSIPLSYRELQSVVRSTQAAKGKSYKYKCHDMPCVDFCNSKLCAKREFGIPDDVAPSISKKEEPDVGSIFKKLRKIDSIPARWELLVEDTPIIVTVDVLNDFNKLRCEIMNKLTRHVPFIKRENWDIILSRLFEKVEIKSVPTEISLPAQVKVLLFEWIARCDFSKPLYHTSNFQDHNDVLKKLDSGAPVIHPIEEEACIIWKGQKFIDWVDMQRKARHTPGINDLWDICNRTFGVSFVTIILNDKEVDVWTMRKDCYENYI